MLPNIYPTGIDMARIKQYFFKSFPAYKDTNMYFVCYEEIECGVRNPGSNTDPALPPYSIESYAHFNVTVRVYTVGATQSLVGRWKVNYTRAIKKGNWGINLEVVA